MAATLTDKIHLMLIGNGSTRINHSWFHTIPSTYRPESLLNKEFNYKSCFIKLLHKSYEKVKLDTFG